MSARLLVVSHPAVVGVNQEVYRELRERGWEPTIVVPAQWRGEFSGATLRPRAIEGLEGTLAPTRAVLAGRPQRHLYVTRPGAMLDRIAPDVAFLEAEPFSLVASQWRRPLHARGIPFGVQCAENIDRELPGIVRRLRSQVLRDAAFVAARSDSAARLVQRWGARGEVRLAPHAVPPWEPYPHREDGAFTVGYAGRLVESKGLRDLLAAVRMLPAPVELVLIGDGAMRGELEGQEIPGSRVQVLDGLTHERMAEGFARLDVLALPSLTTPTWKEQFGRVIVEALWCEVPVVGSDSGEIPWLIELTGGGLVFPEGDAAALAARLTELREDPELRRRLASTGRDAARRMFSVPAAADPLEQMLEGALGRGAARAAAEPAGR
jgi:glycosyltransferase involved in cell wall biosynthesis